MTAGFFVVVVNTQCISARMQNKNFEDCRHQSSSSSDYNYLVVVSPSPLCLDDRLRYVVTGVPVDGYADFVDFVEA